MHTFDNLVILSKFKLPKNFGNCLPKKPCRIYVLTFEAQFLYINAASV